MTQSVHASVFASIILCDRLNQLCQLIVAALVCESVTCSCPSSSLLSWGGKDGDVMLGAGWGGVLPDSPAYPTFSLWSVRGPKPGLCSALEQALATCSAQQRAWQLPARDYSSGKRLSHATGEQTQRKSRAAGCITLPIGCIHYCHFGFCYPFCAHSHFTLQSLLGLVFVHF